jgi:hypothetical protein
MNEQTNKAAVDMTVEETTFHAMSDVFVPH